MDLKRPQISSFREQNSVPPETWIPEFHARAHMVCPSSCLGSLGQIELQGGDLTFERISEWNSGSETAFIRPFDCAIFYFVLNTSFGMVATISLAILKKRPDVLSDRTDND